MRDWLSGWVRLRDCQICHPVYHFYPLSVLLWSLRLHAYIAKGCTYTTLFKEKHYLINIHPLFFIQEEQLRIALLDYLRSHGNDPEKIQMVALKFGMFRELAKTKEDQAMSEVKSIKTRQLGE